MTRSPTKKQSEKRSSLSSSQKSAASKPKQQRRQNDGNKSQQQRSSVSGRRVTVMGLDLSLRSTGLVVARGRPEEAPKVLRARTLRTEALGNSLGTVESGLRPSGNYRGDHEECIEFTRKKILATFRKFTPDLVVIEDYPFMKNSRSISVLYEQGGVIKNALHKVEATFLVRKPTVFKAYATGHGGASKQEMITTAKKSGFTGATNSDVADAYWIARYGIDKYDELIDTLGDDSHEDA